MTYDCLIIKVLPLPSYCLSIQINLFCSHLTTSLYINHPISWSSRKAWLFITIFAILLFFFPLILGGKKKRKRITKAVVKSHAFQLDQLFKLIYFVTTWRLVYLSDVLKFYHYSPIVYLFRLIYFVATWQLVYR